jgi:pyruvate-formate lyase
MVTQLCATLSKPGTDDLLLVPLLTPCRQLRTPEYNDLFAGDPTWVTCVLAGTDESGKHMVTKTAFRMLNTLYNLGPAPEPNLTVLWNANLPENFKKFCAKVRKQRWDVMACFASTANAGLHACKAVAWPVGSWRPCSAEKLMAWCLVADITSAFCFLCFYQVSMDTSSIQYESDQMMSPLFGSDYGIACCVSAMRIGKDMQFFGARCNLPKLLLYIMNGGRDEVTGDQVGPAFPALSTGDGPLKYDEIVNRLDEGMAWLAKLYCNTMNVIHYMHDKYDYERIQVCTSAACPAAGCAFVWPVSAVVVSA